jgi:hypothetical protein
MKKNTQKLSQSLERRLVGLDVNAKETKYTVMLRDQNARQNQNTQINKKIFCKGPTVQIFGNNPNESKFHS